MNTIKTFLVSAFAALVLPTAFAADFTDSVVGVQGHDLVSYHTAKKPLPGNGNYTSTYKGVNYLFVNQANKETFDRNPEKYLPAYGGYCAYGASVGKKFN